MRMWQQLFDVNHIGQTLGKKVKVEHKWGTKIGHVVGFKYSFADRQYRVAVVSSDNVTTNFKEEEVYDVKIQAGINVDVEILDN